MTSPAALVSISIVGTIAASFGAGYLIYRLEQKRYMSEQLRRRLEHAIVALERMKLHPGTRLSEDRYYDFLVAVAYLPGQWRDECIAAYDRSIHHAHTPTLSKGISELQDSLRSELS